MALNYTTVQAYVNDRLDSDMANAVFRENNAFFAMLAQNRRDFQGGLLKTRIEYAKHSNIDNLGRGEELTISHKELATNAKWTPKMFTGSMFLYKEDELEVESGGDLAVENLLNGVVDNLRESLDEKASDNAWVRGATAGDLDDTDGWNTVEHLVDDGTTPNVDPGDIDPATYSWWVPNVLGASDFNTGDLTNPDDLMDSTKETYIFAILRRMYAQSRYLKGSRVGLFVVPQYIWDMMDHILSEQKTGSPMDLQIGDATFSAINFRRIPVVADDAMVDAQSSDVDGRLYAFDMRFFYLALNSGAAFTAEDFVRPANANYRTSLVNAYGNIICTNRAAQVVVEDVYSPQNYVN